MKKSAKKEEVKEVGELLEKYQKLISWAMDELGKANIVGTLLSLNEKPDIAFAGQVLTSVLENVREEFWQEVGRHYHHKDPNPDRAIPF